MILFSIDIMIFKFCTGPALHSAHVGGGGLHEGFDTLDYRKIKHWDAGKLGNYHILSVLPNKFVRFLFEFHDFLFTSLDLPPLPADRSNFDVHENINTDQVWILLYQCACV